MKKICILGLGYIGLPTAAILTRAGYEVFGVDVNKSVIDAINKGKVHIFEPNLDMLVKRAVENNLLQAGINVVKADIFILAVPTPFKDNHKPDISYVEAAVKEIIPCLEKGNLVILESTSPVGTTEYIANIVYELRKDLQNNDILFAHCPERVLPGRILDELVNNDRIIGGLNKESTEVAKAFYSTFVKGELITTDSKTAELSKLVENSYRDVNIAFANELSIICDKLKIDVWELISIANHHPRVNILNPGPGVGGHCIAVDPWFIVDSVPRESKLIHMAREINDYKPIFVFDKIENIIKKIKNPKIACLGLAFKADVDDLRESPAIKIVDLLSNNKDSEILVVEPYIKTLPNELDKKENVTLSKYHEDVEKADVIILLVDHNKFKNEKLSNLNNKILIDTRGIYDINNDFGGLLVRI